MLTFFDTERITDLSTDNRGSRENGIRYGSSFSGQITSWSSDRPLLWRRKVIFNRSSRLAGCRCVQKNHSKYVAFMYSALVFFLNFKLNCTEYYVSLRRQTYFRSSLLSSSKVKKRQPEIQLNLSITVALGLEENGLCREVTVVERLKQESMYGRYAKKWPLQRGGRCGEVAVVERWPL